MAKMKKRDKFNKSLKKGVGEIKEQSKFKKILYWFYRCIYIILYIAILTILWGYIVLNWEECISMQFFSQFDGNNILFLVGIVLTILPFYEVEGKGIKIKGIGVKALHEDLERTRNKYLEDSMQNIIDKTQSKEQTKSDGSGSK